MRGQDRGENIGITETKKETFLEYRRSHCADAASFPRQLQHRKQPEKQSSALPDIKCQHGLPDAFCSHRI